MISKLSLVSSAMFVIPTICLAFAVSGVAYILADLATCPRTFDPALGRFEHERRQRLRSTSSLYRFVEPWVDELAEPLGQNAKRCAEVRKNLIGAGGTAPWAPEEFLAIKRIEAILAACFASVLGWILGGWTLALLASLLIFVLYEELARRALRSDAIRRTLKMKRRFAAIVDLMALVMEVGASFQDSLEVAVQECRGHPLGDELILVRRDMAMGRRDEALRQFANRVQDDDIGEFVMAVIEGENSGAPLARTFRIQADQMRQKRSQWAEKAAAESEVALVFPAMLIMAACLVLIAAPFVLSALFTPGG